jgi:hypothetical protein
MLKIEEESGELYYFNLDKVSYIQTEEYDDNDGYYVNVCFDSDNILDHINVTTQEHERINKELSQSSGEHPCK